MAIPYACMIKFVLLFHTGFFSSFFPSKSTRLMNQSLFFEGSWRHSLFCQSCFVLKHPIDIQSEVAKFGCYLAMILTFIHKHLLNGTFWVFFLEKQPTQESQQLVQLPKGHLRVLKVNQPVGFWVLLIKPTKLTKPLHCGLAIRIRLLIAREVPEGLKAQSEGRL